MQVSWKGKTFHQNKRIFLNASMCHSWRYVFKYRCQLNLKYVEFFFPSHRYWEFLNQNHELCYVMQLHLTYLHLCYIYLDLFQGPTTRITIFLRTSKNVHWKYTTCGYNHVDISMSPLKANNSVVPTIKGKINTIPTT